VSDYPTFPENVYEPESSYLKFTDIDLGQLASSIRGKLPSLEKRLKEIEKATIPTPELWRLEITV